MKLCVSVCLQVVLVGVLWGSVSQELDPEVLIDKYNSCNKKFETIYYDLENTLQVRSKKYVYSLKHCSNHEKMQWIGGLKCYKKDGTIDQQSSSLIVNIFDDKRWIVLHHYNPELKSKNPPRAFIQRSSREKVLQDLNETTSRGAPLKGKLDGSNGQSIYDLLKGAPNLTLHDKVTKIIGYDTYLIEADTKYGVVKAWISPDLDYNCLKWEIIKAQNQFYRDGKLTNDRFTGWTAVYDAEKVEQIDGQYFITKAKFNKIVKNGDIVLSDSTYHYNLKNIDLNPDYEALGAFEIQLPEGTVVTHEEVPGIQFRWTNGKFVPDMDDYLYKNLTGKPLPSLESFMKGLEQDYNKGKMVLVCFWDRNQRPSRNCIMQLAKQAKQLKQKGVAVVIVQASKVDEKKLNEWVKKNNIPFPVGMVQGDEEKIHLAWGVKSLPWLILTDREHQVVTEGITLQVLDDKLKTD